MQWYRQNTFWSVFLANFPQKIAAMCGCVDCLYNYIIDWMRTIVFVYEVFARAEINVLFEIHFDYYFCWIQSIFTTSADYQHLFCGKYKIQLTASNVIFIAKWPISRLFNFQQKMMKKCVKCFCVTERLWLVMLDYCTESKAQNMKSCRVSFRIHVLQTIGNEVEKWSFFHVK